MKRHTIGRGRLHAVRSPAAREAKLRAALIAYLGMAAEDPSVRRGRYTSSTTELFGWARAKRAGGAHDTWQEAG